MEQTFSHWEVTKINDDKQLGQNEKISRNRHLNLGMSLIT